jgi:hypothetical protein
MLPFLLRRRADRSLQEIARPLLRAGGSIPICFRRSGRCGIPIMATCWLTARHRPDAGGQLQFKAIHNLLLTRRNLLRPQRTVSPHNPFYTDPLGIFSLITKMNLRAVDCGAVP